MPSLWEQLHPLFESDDGSLPDIYIEPLSGSEVIEIYGKVMSQAGIYGNPTLWSKEESRDVPIRQLRDPAGLVVQGEAESFRHGLTDLEINNVALPELTICVEPNGVSFDYRMGLAWGPQEVEALLEFLLNLVRNKPHARVFHADEGSYQNPTKLFSRVWDSYKKERVTS